MCTQEGDCTRVYLRTSTLKEMNNDGDVDTDEDNCDLDYRAMGDLILKTKGKSIFNTPRTILLVVLSARLETRKNTSNNG